MTSPVTNETDTWLLVDATHPGFNGMLASSATQHKIPEPDAKLSVTMRLDGAEALVKVRGGKGWTPAWLNTPLVLRIFTPEDHDEAVVMVHTPTWEAPDAEDA